AFDCCAPFAACCASAPSASEVMAAPARKSRRDTDITASFGESRQEQARARENRKAYHPAVFNHVPRQVARAPSPALADSRRPPRESCASREKKPGKGRAPG